MEVMVIAMDGGSYGNNSLVFLKLIKPEFRKKCFIACRDFLMLRVLVWLNKGRGHVQEFV